MLVSLPLRPNGSCGLAANLDDGVREEYTPESPTPSPTVCAGLSCEYEAESKNLLGRSCPLEESEGDR